ncbi:MAG TPA: SCO family protein [Elusimicrobiota bacterium]|nr:SCO family protein [Elusimicrobiota bacterium]
MKIRTTTAVAAALAAAALAAACGKKPAPSTTVYSTAGTVEQVRPSRLQIVIDADAIPGFMDAMTMGYSVKDASLLKGLKPGERISFKLVVTPREDYIRSLSKIKGAAAKLSPLITPRPDNAAFIHLPKIGDAAPDIALIDEDGRPWRMSEERGKVAAFTFIYTSCPFASYCPRSMHEFALLKRDLGPLVGRRVDLFSVSFDSKRDTPAALKRYGRHFGAGVPGWRLLTGKPLNLEKFVSFFDVNYWSGPNGDINNHSLSTVLVGPDGRVAFFQAGNGFTAKELARAVRKLLKSSGPKS